MNTETQKSQTYSNTKGCITHTQDMSIYITRDRNM